MFTLRLTGVNSLSFNGGLAIFVNYIRGLVPTFGNICRGLTLFDKLRLLIQNRLPTTD